MFYWYMTLNYFVSHRWVHKRTRAVCPPSLLSYMAPKTDQRTWTTGHVDTITITTGCTRK